MDQLIVNVALTGLFHSKADNPNVPLTPQEIAADVKRCVNAGASVFHVHARDARGNATFNPHIYAEIVREVRAVCPEAIICGSTSGRIFKDFRERSAVLNVAGIDMASLTTGSLNFPTGASINDNAMIKALLSRMLENRIKPELECFEIGHVQAARRLEVQGWYNLFLGISIEADSHWLVEMIRELPEDAIWAGAGTPQKKIIAWATALGGHVRVGLEDCLHLDGKLATNAGLVEQAVLIGRAMGREPVSCAEVRRLLWKS